MTEHHLVSLWRQATERALQLDPAEIAATIRATAYDGLRASGGGSRSSGHGDPTFSAAASGIPEPDEAGHGPRVDRFGSSALRTRELRDLDHLAVAERAYIAAVGAAGRACHSRGVPTTWAEATQDAHLLLEAGYLADAVKLGLVRGRIIDLADEATRTIERVHDGHCGHAPDPFAQHHGERTPCRSHARIGAAVARSTKTLCRWCWRHVQDLAPVGEPVELQLDPAHWPSEEMLRAHVDGRTMDVARYARDWLVSHGVDPVTAHRRRQQSRGA